MKRADSFLIPRVLCFLLLFVWADALPGQSSSFVVITPQSATLLVGESRPFRLVDQNGQLQRNVTWTVSDPDALQVNGGDQLTIMAKQAGDFHVRAQSKSGSAEATVKVMEGKMPVGTKIWSGGTVPGCKSVQLVQAMPSANGPDMYETSHCADGDYVTALTLDGMQLWRRRIGTPGATSATPDNKNIAEAARINLGSTSICDSVSVGTGQQKIRDLLHQRNISFSEGASDKRVWIVEESNKQCELWFDDKLVLTKKRKVFVTE
jgi:Bacterial Ig-like domain (group 2)